MSESFAELFEQSLVNKEMRPGTIVTGTVVDIQSDAVIVNAGLKSEGVIPIEQFYNNQGEVEVAFGMPSRCLWMRLRMVLERPGCRVKKPSVPKSGNDWNALLKRVKLLPVLSTVKLKVVSLLI